MEATGSAGQVRLAVSSYTEPVPHCAGCGRGVSIFALELATGRLALERVIPPAVCGANPSYLALSRGVLLVANETSDLARSTVRAIGGILGDEPRLLACAPVAGTAACHLCVAGEQLLVANYGDGSVVGFGLGQEGAALGEQAMRVSLGAGAAFPGAVAGRQEGPHAHAVIAAGRSAVFVTDLGSNCVWRIARDAGSGAWSATPQLAFAALPGAGPRHAAMHPTLPRLYVLNELAGSVTSLALGEGGSLSRLQDDVPLHAQLSGRPESAGAAIRAHPNGRWLYASLRAGQGGSCVSHFDVDGATGRLTFRAAVSTHATPRDFALVVADAEGGSDGRSYAVVACQDADDLLVFRISGDGSLEALPHEPMACESAVCVLPLV